jgi:serine/threonine protein kinase
MTSKLYTLDGDIINFHELYENKPFFRKMTNSSTELEIFRMLFKHNNDNIVKVYRIGHNYVDIELLIPIVNNKNSVEIKKIMTDVKNYLQNVGIIYIDWKLDNIGITKNNIYKLYDFDASGIINLNTHEWIKRPALYYSYNQATDAGLSSPIEIDNFIFDLKNTFTVI